MIPEGDHEPLRQRMVLLKRAGATATQFYAYLQGTGRARFFESTGTECHNSRPWTGRPSVFRSGWARARSRSCSRVGVWFGRLLAVHHFRGKLLVEALVTVPLVLPPTVLGFYLLVMFGARSPLGQAFQSLVGQIAAVLVRGAAARVRDRQHPLRRPADPARLRGDSVRRA